MATRATLAQSIDWVLNASLATRVAIQLTVRSRIAMTSCRFPQGGRRIDAAVIERAAKDGAVDARAGGNFLFQRGAIVEPGEAARGDHLGRATCREGVCQ